MRRYLVWMLAALFALLPVAGLAADNRDTQITTTLPEEHTITVVCGADGGFRVNGTVYTGEKAFAVERLSAFELEAVPDAGYRLSQVKAQPSGSVSTSGNMVTIGSVYEDKTLTQSFVREEPKPTPTPTPTPTLTPTPTPTPTATPTPTPTASAATHTASPTPTPSRTEDGETDESDTSTAFDLPYVIPKGNVLYDRYLGTGVGLSELGIVYDEAYELDEYELLAVLYEEDQAEVNTLLVVAQPDEDGTYAQRSLVLSGLQLARLWQEKKIEWIELRSGDASALVRIEELLSGDSAKLIAWALRDPQAAQPDIAKNLPAVKLTVAELRNIRIEVRVTPAEAEGYQIGVYAWYDGRQIAISELAPSLTIGLNAGEQGDEAARAGYVATHRLSATDATGAATSLTGVLQKLPPDETAANGGQSERFNASLEAETNVVVLYDPEKSLDSYQRWALCADWAGEATYRLVTLELEQ